MSDVLFEILFSAIFELGAEIFGGIFGNRGDKPGRAKASRSRQYRAELIAKLATAALFGVVWGFYVNGSTGGAWPVAFWSFSAFAIIAWLLSRSGISNEERMSRGTSMPFVRNLLTFNAERFTTVALVSTTAAAGIAIGFFIGG